MMRKYSQVLKISTFLFILFKCCSCQRRIYDGSNAKPNQFPYTVIVRTRYSSSCGGALLSERFILTAAHCIMDVDDDEEVNVAVGAYKYYDYNEPGRLKFYSRKYWIHENFSMPSAVNDLAIIELPVALNFSDQIQPIKVSTDQNLDADGDDKELLVVMSGWGYKNDEYLMAETLQTARMKLVPYDKCVKFQSHYVEKLTRDHICAIGRDKSPESQSLPCTGDSGGPLVLADSGELIGITSFIKDAENGTALYYNDCKTKIAPAVFVRISSYLDWISEKTGMKFEKTKKKKDEAQK